MGKKNSCSIEATDGEDHRSNNWQKNQKEDLFLIPCEVERPSRRRWQLDK
jgi:hypothetical protein